MQVNRRKVVVLHTDCFDGLFTGMLVSLSLSLSESKLDGDDALGFSCNKGYTSDGGSHSDDIRTSIRIPTLDLERFLLSSLLARFLSFFFGVSSELEDMQIGFFFSCNKAWTIMRTGCEDDDMRPNTHENTNLRPGPFSLLFRLL